jgi:prevent-host-death family protein
MILVMKQISIQDLKAKLSAAVSEAESGNTIVITRHNEPVAKIVPARPEHQYRGQQLGKSGLKPAIKRGAKIPYLQFLLDDRGDR